jgi:tRNA A37 threonylcarbamoyladenosine dehydratase
VNRQAVAFRSTVGMLKTDALARILRDIVPDIKLTLIPRYITPEDAGTLLADAPDFAVDAIDDVPAKTAFLLAARQKDIPLISAMGAGGRVDPSQIRECDISKTCQCGLARAVRTRLREAGVHSGIRVVFSPEVPVKTSPVGTVSYMPNLFGCFCAAAAIRSLTGK